MSSYKESCLSTTSYILTNTRECYTMPQQISNLEVGLNFELYVYKQLLIHTRKNIPILVAIWETKLISQQEDQMIN